MSSVLVIDDEPEVREVTSLMLTRAGYETFSVESAEQGLEVLATKPISVALIDVILPGKNGLEFVLELNRKWPNVPIVLMSGRISTEADSIQNFNGHFGVSCSISKPFTKDQLLYALSNAINS